MPLSPKLSDSIQITLPGDAALKIHRAASLAGGNKLTKGSFHDLFLGASLGLLESFFHEDIIYVNVGTHSIHKNSNSLTHLQLPGHGE